jgi:hypothetical protein
MSNNILSNSKQPAHNKGVRMAVHDDSQDFIKQADMAQTRLLVEIWQWLRQNKKWWLAPIVVMLLVVGFLVFLSGTAVAPFIYTLF